MSSIITCDNLLIGLEKSRNLLLENHQLLNELNYFPVADKDTGTNMAVSFQKSCDSIFEKKEYSTPKEIIESLVNALILFGHGNSGTILTMFFDGFLCSLPDTPSLNGTDISNAFSSGSQSAYDAVVNPMMGTILSVARDAANAALSISDATNDAGIVINRIVTEAHASLSRTAFINPVLKDKKICDSGAYGFCLILDGLFLSIFSEDSLPPYDLRFLQVSDRDNNVDDLDDLHLEYRFCTEFVLTLNDRSGSALLESRISGMGDCFLMINKESVVKIHIHTNEPEKVLEYASEFGNLTSTKIDDMTV